MQQRKLHSQILYEEKNPNLTNCYSNLTLTPAIQRFRQGSCFLSRVGKSKGNIELNHFKQNFSDIYRGYVKTPVKPTK